MSSLFKNINGFQYQPKAVILCNIQANPPASVQWLFNGMDINDKIKSGFYKDYAKPEINCLPQQCKLTFFSLRYELHHGKYACVAKNSIGQANRTFNVIVRGTYQLHTFLF